MSVIKLNDRPRDEQMLVSVVVVRYHCKFKGKLETKQKSQTCVEAAIAFVCISCNWQLLFAQLQLTTFVWTTAFDNFCSALLQLSTFLCTMLFANVFFIEYCNWNLLYEPLQYYNWLLYALLQLATFYAL